MGILKNLTDEYFGESIRGEEGKYIEVHGFKALVPPEYDENMFLGLVEDILTEGEAEFVRSRNKNDNFYNMECGNDFCISLNDLDDIREVIEDDGWYVLTDKQFKSAIDFIGYLVSEISIDVDRSNDYLVLADEGDVYNKLDMSFYDAKLDDWQAQECYDGLIDWFIEEFSDYSKANIVKDEIHTIQYYNTSLNLKLTDNSNNIMFKTLLWAKDMVKWWDEHLNELEKMGAREYFGFEPEEDESEE